MRTVFLLLAQRMRSNRRLLAALLLGVLLAAALLASAPIYARSMADTGLAYALSRRLSIPPTLKVETHEAGFPLGTPEARAAQAAVAQRIRDRLGWFTRDYGRYYRTPALTVGQPGQPLPQGSSRPVILLQALDGFDQHVRVTSGALPPAIPTAEGIPEFPIAISQQAAAFAGLNPGDHILLGDLFDDCERHPPSMDRPPDPPCTPHSIVQFSVPAVIAGYVEPLRADDSFWVDGAEAYFKGASPFADRGPRIPAFMPSATMTGAFAALFPGYSVTQHWYANANVEKLNRDNYKRAQAEIRTLRDELGPAGFFAFTPVDNAIDDFNQKYAYDQAPLLVLLLQIAGIALFYVAIVGAMTVERQQPETALLRSRGASVLQILAIYLGEGLVLALPATLLGPFLGVAFTRALGVTPVFHNVTGGHLLRARVDGASFALAGLGAILSALALLVPAFFSARFSGVSARRGLGRPSATLVQRYYLDLALAAVCGMLLWELQTKGTVFKPGTAGGLSSDPLLLLSPALLTLAVAALALRIYPPLLRLAARLFAAGSGVTIVAGLWQMTRNPAQYTRLGLLLMMGIAIGAFAASYSDTTARSYQERALYQAGVEVRAATGLHNGLGRPDEADALFRKMPGVADASGAARLDVELGTAGTVHDRVQLLAVDPAAGGRMLWYRPGLSDQSLDTLMSDLGLPTQTIGRPLPGEPVSFSIWVRPAVARENTTVWVRIRDAEGRYSMFDFGKLTFTGWQQMSTPLSSIGTRPVFPISLVSIVLTEPSNTLDAKAQPIFFDDFSVTQPDGRTETVEEFEGISSWLPAATAAGIQDEVAVVNEDKHGGARSLKFSFPPGAPNGVRAFYISDPNVPLPAIVSRGFAARTGVKVGGISALYAGDHLVPIRVKAIADLFPTLDPRRDPFVIVNRIHLVEWLDRITSSTLDYVNEIWLRTTPDADRAALIAQITSPPYQLGGLIDLGKERQLARADPLLVSSGSGVLLVSFVAALVLVAGAFLVTLFTSLRRRRIEFAVMTALGLGRARVLALLAFEFAVVSAIGAAVGIALGLGVSRMMLSFLDVTENGDKVLPPYVLVTNWSVIALALAILAGIVLAGIILAARIFTEDPASVVLRNTE